MANVRLKVLYPRPFKGQDGQNGTSWMQVGRAYMNDKGVDIQLWVAPLPNSEEGHIKLILREDDGRPAQAQGGYRGEQGGRGRVAQAFGQGGPQGGPGAAQGGLKPQHRDNLGQGGQQALYGGAAAQREPGEDDDQIPF